METTLRLSKNQKKLQKGRHAGNMALVYKKRKNLSRSQRHIDSDVRYEASFGDFLELIFRLLMHNWFLEFLIF